MSKENLKLVAEGLNSFLTDIDQVMADDPALEQKVFANVQPDEMEAFLNFAARIAKVSSDEERTDSALMLRIQAMEMTTAIFHRVVPPSDIAKSLPAELRTQECADLLNDLGAKTLASLCSMDEAKPVKGSKFFDRPGLF